jgi:ribonucleoside-diphosphate reductase alpha chain
VTAALGAGVQQVNKRRSVCMANSILSDNAVTIASSRYFIDDQEDWEGLSQRVGGAAARAENGDAVEYRDKFAEIIYNLEFLPGGRILRNTGRPRGSLFNCYVLPVGDSREEIGQWLKDSLILWGEGGGVGCNLSYLRPRGAIIKGVGGNSSGPVSFLEASDAVASTIESGGSRRAAALACMNVSHPDIMEFIDAKMTHGKLSHYNISVGVTEDFLLAVEADNDWEFKFAQQSYGTVKAREIWDKIIDNMVRFAEPGLINWDNLTSNNSYYFDPILSTNPCGEVPLSGYGACDLGSIVLSQFVSPNGQTRRARLEEVVRLAIRFLDDIIDINKYVLNNISVNAYNGRRIGLGIMGLAEYLFAKGVRYGSDKAIEETESVMKLIRNTAYLASVELAIEKGAFPKFDAVQYGKAHFIRTLPAKALRMQIKEKGIRNVTCMAMAPTGTISLLPEVTSGIEPLFRKAYLRSDRVGDRMYIHPLYKDILNNGGKVPEWFVDTGDLKPEDHFEMQSIVQKYVDGAVSKTINMPSDTTVEQLSKLTLEYVHDLKGVTVYVDGSREGQILNTVSMTEVKDFLKSGATEVPADEDSINCVTGACEI